MEDLQKDSRFAHISRDPKFRRMKRKDRKVHIDKRFKSMLNSSRFTAKQSVGKRGEPLKSSTKEDLERFYEIESSDEDDNDDEGDDENSNKRSTNAKHTSPDATSDDSSNEEELDDEADRARGSGRIETSSSEEESGDELSELGNETFAHDWGEMDKDAEVTDEVTSRLALCNMDWDRIKAQDILMLMNSVKPTGGIIKSVTIYPSELGQKALAEEDIRGPSQMDSTKDNSSEAEKQELLRRYQLNRLRYYYAVIECDTSDTANHVYEQCDGVEYETSSNKLDLRFIPDDMTFDQAPHSIAKDVLDAGIYKPSQYRTNACTHSSVKLTWDETDPDRLAVTMRKFTKDDLDSMNMKDYLASSSSSEEDEDSKEVQAAPEEETDQEKLSKYRELVKGIQGSEGDKEKKDTDIEVRWEPGLKENAEKLVEKKKKEEDQTVWEGYLEKRKEKRREKRKAKKQNLAPATESSEDEIPSDVDLDDPFFKEELEKQGYEPSTKRLKTSQKSKNKKEEDEDKSSKAALSLLLMDGEEDGREHFNLKDIQKADQQKMSKKKKRRMRKKMKEGEQKTEDNFQMDLSDPRFSAVFNDPEFNIDPSAPEFKKTAAMDSLIQEKVKLRATKMRDTSQAGKTADFEKSSDKSNIAQLVKNVKTKTKTMQEKKKMKTKYKKDLRKM